MKSYLFIMSLFSSFVFAQNTYTSIRCENKLNTASAIIEIYSKSNKFSIFSFGTKDKESFASLDLGSVSYVNPLGMILEINSSETYLPLVTDKAKLPEQNKIFISYYILNSNQLLSIQTPRFSTPLSCALD